MINTLRGVFETSIGGALHRFDTALGTIAAIEDRCGDVPIVEVINRAVFAPRAKDRIALLAAALAAAGHAPAEAERQAATASVAEAEAFILALMGALGFEIAPRGTEETRPLAGASAGGGGGPSRSAL